jgi:formylglycine-generating enzyme required for sulfatase activity
MSIHAQTIRNVNFIVQGAEIHITYDLLGSDANIQLYYSLDKGITWNEPNANDLSGDIGNKITPDNGKIIIWNPLVTLPWFFSDYVMFKVAAIKGFTENVAGVDVEMVFIAGGTYTMGCTNEQGSDCENDEKPVHSVTVDDFYMGKYEVTQAQWEAVMGSNPSNFSGCDNCPVEQVSWDDILDFLEKLNQKTGKIYRLPTEAEWEFAARGGNSSRGYKYSGSNNVSSVGWYDENSGSKTHSVGQKASNELGIYDMSGNVWEWCSDWYGDYSSGNQTNPKGPTSGYSRVIRGGGWDYIARDCRSANRGIFTPGSGGYYLGFRLVLSPK